MQMIKWSSKGVKCLTKSLSIIKLFYSKGMKFIKKTRQHTLFLVDIAKYLGAPILKTSWIHHQNSWIDISLYIFKLTERCFHDCNVIVTVFLKDKHSLLLYILALLVLSSVFFVWGFCSCFGKCPFHKFCFPILVKNILHLLSLFQDKHKLALQLPDAPELDH